MDSRGCDMVADGAPQDDNSCLSRVGTRCGMGSLLAFFSTRVLRGGPKILLYLATCLVLLLVVIKVLPEHLNQDPFGSKSIPFLDWTGSKNDDESQQGETTDGGDASGGAASGPLRIVVFGENDIATPSRIQGLGGSKKHRAWTEVLCEEVCDACSQEGRGTCTLAVVRVDSADTFWYRSWDARTTFRSFLPSTTYPVRWLPTNSMPPPWIEH